MVSRAAAAGGDPGWQDETVITPQTETRLGRTLLQVRITVAGSEPSIWRLLEVDSSLSLGVFHDVIQTAMGWWDSHLHYFSEADPNVPPPLGRDAKNGPRSWAPAAMLDDKEGALPEADWTLGQVLTPGNRTLFYEYDLGDGWTHRIDLMGSRPAAAADPTARLLDGARRAPLEDSGGIHGYQRLLAVLHDPTHRDHGDAKNWVAGVRGPWGEFDPTALETEAANAALLQLFEDTPPPDASSTQALAHRMLPVARRHFLAYVAAAGVDQPALVDPETAAAMAAPYLWLIRRIGHDGIALTEAGWLPPILVQETMAELGWDRRWIGKGNREVQTVPVLALRETCQELRLIRKFKGRMVLTSSGKGLLEDPEALWLFLARSLANRSRHDAELDATLLLLLEIAAGRRTEWSELVGAVAYGLSMLGWATSAGNRLPQASVRELLRGPRRILQNLGFFGGPVEWLSKEASARDLAHQQAFARAVLQA